MHRAWIAPLTLSGAMSLVLAQQAAAADVSLKIDAAQAAGGPPTASYCSTDEAARLPTHANREHIEEPNPSDVEQKATRYLSCCLYMTDAKACADNTVRWLAWAHERQARHRQGTFFGETDVAAAGAAGLVVGGTKAAATTTSVWSLAALAPVIVEDVAGFGPRSQVHYGATQAFYSLVEHYDARTAELQDIRGLAAENYKLEQACRSLTGVNDVKDDAHASDAALFNIEVANFKAYCKDYEASLGAFRPYRDAMSRAQQRLARQYIVDATNLEGVFHKISFSLQAPPSMALSIVLAAPFDALSSAIHSGKTVNEYKARSATFDLEKDGFDLANPWPPATAPATQLPSSGIAVSPKGTASASAVDSKTGAMAILALLQAVDTESTAALEWNRKANQVVADLSGEAGTYKMVFDFRAEKATAVVQFTKTGSSKQ